MAEELAYSSSLMRAAAPQFHGDVHCRCRCVLVQAVRRRGILRVWLGPLNRVEDPLDGAGPADVDEVLTGRGVQQAGHVQAGDLDQLGDGGRTVLDPHPVCDWFELAGKTRDVDDAPSQAVTGQVGEVLQVVSISKQISNGPLRRRDRQALNEGDVVGSQWEAVDAHGPSGLLAVRDGHLGMSSRRYPSWC